MSDAAVTPAEAQRAVADLSSLPGMQGDTAADLSSLPSVDSTSTLPLFLVNVSLVPALAGPVGSQWHVFGEVVDAATIEPGEPIGDWSGLMPEELESLQSQVPRFKDEAADSFDSSEALRDPRCQADEDEEAESRSQCRILSASRTSSGNGAFSSQQLIFPSLSQQSAASSPFFAPLATTEKDRALLSKFRWVIRAEIARLEDMPEPSFIERVKGMRESFLGRTVGRVSAPPEAFRLPVVSSTNAADA